MPEVDKGQVTVVIESKRSRALPDLVVLAAPSHERFVEAAYGLEGLAAHGDRSAMGVLRDPSYGRSSEPRPRGDYSGSLAGAQVEEKALEIHDVRAGEVAEQGTRIPTWGEDVVVVEHEQVAPGLAGTDIEGP